MDSSYIITGIIAIFASTGFWAFVQHMLDKKSNRSKIVMGLAYVNIKSSCTKLIDRGWASPEEIEDIDKYLFEPYKAMGGNGMAEMLMDRVRKLPSKPKGGECYL